MNLYLIGNGFDCHHNLKTNYCYFKNYVMQRNPKLVNKIDDLFNEIIPNYLEKSEDIEKWSILEKYLGQIHDLDYEEFYNYALSNSEQDDERASYFEDPLYNASVLSDKYKVFNELNNYFEGWVKSINTSIASKDENLTLACDDFYINFNYTDTLERLYKIPSNNVFHIHIKNGKFILGHNRFYNKPFSNPYYIYVQKWNGLLVPALDDDYRHTSVRERLNDLYDDIFYTYYKNSQNIINNNKQIFDNIINYKRIVIMGPSLGSEDEVYIEYLSKIMLDVKEIIYYYHNPKEEPEMRNVIFKYFKNVRLVAKYW